MVAVSSQEAAASKSVVEATQGDKEGNAQECIEEIVEESCVGNVQEESAQDSVENKIHQSDNQEQVLVDMEWKTPPAEHIEGNAKEETNAKMDDRKNEQIADENLSGNEKAELGSKQNCRFL